MDWKLLNYSAVIHSRAREREKAGVPDHKGEVEFFHK